MARPPTDAFPFTRAECLFLPHPSLFGVALGRKDLKCQETARSLEKAGWDKPISPLKDAAAQESRSRLAETKVVRTLRNRCHYLGTLAGKGSCVLEGLGRGSRTCWWQWEVTQDLSWPEMRSHVAGQGGAKPSCLPGIIAWFPDLFPRARHPSEICLLSSHG